jgi:phosphoglycolate phosphatase
MKSLRKIPLLKLYYNDYLTPFILKVRSMSRVRKYEHIIWDWNGTLFNDVELCVDIINGILVNHYLSPLTINQYKEIFTFPVKDYYAKAGLDFTKYSFEELGSQWMKEYQRRRKEGKLYDKAKDTLDFISSEGIEQSVLSAYMHDDLLEVIKNFRIDSYFTHIAGLNHIYATSKVDIGKDLMNKISYGNVLMIGDTIHDYEVAKEIGADCILIADGHQSAEKLTASGVPVLSNLNELSSLF